MGHGVLKPDRDRLVKEDGRAERGGHRGEDEGRPGGNQTRRWFAMLLRRNAPLPAGHTKSATDACHGRENAD